MSLPLATNDSTAKTNRKLPAEAAAVWNDFEGPWAADVFRWADAIQDQCYVGGETVLVPCPFSEMVTEVTAYAEDATATPLHVLVLLGYPAQGGNAFMMERVVFKRQADGRYAFFKKVDGVWGIAKSGRAVNGKILLTAQTLKSGEPRCCPTGETVWAVDLESGEAAYISGYKVE